MNELLGEMLTVKRLFLIVFLGWLQAVQCTSVKKKEVQVLQSGLLAAINQAELQFSFNPREVESLDVSQFVFLNYSSDAGYRFNIGMDRNGEGSNRFVFYLPNSASIEDYLRFALNKVGFLSDTSLDIQISQKIKSTLTFAASTLLKVGTIQLNFSIAELIDIFFSNFHLEDKTVKRNDAKKSVIMPPDDEIELMQETFVAKRPFVVYVPSGYTARAFVEMVANEMKDVDTNVDLFISHMSYSLHTPLALGCQPIQWSLLMDEMEKWHPKGGEAFGIERAPLANDKFKIRWAKAAATKALANSIYIDFGEFVPRPEAFHPATIMADFIASTSLLKWVVHPLQYGFSQMFVACDENARDIYNESAFKLEDLKEKKCDIKYVNDCVKQILGQRTHSLVLDYLKDWNIAEGGAFQFEDFKCKCSSFPLVDNKASAEELIRDYVEFVANRLQATVSRNQLIESFFNEFKNQKTLDDYANELARRPSTKLNDHPPKPKQSNGSGAPFGGSKSSSRHGFSSLTYGLLIGIPLIVLLVVVTIAVFLYRQKAVAAGD